MESSTDLDQIIQNALDLSRALDPNRSFSVQTRIIGEGRLPIRKVEVNEAASTLIEKRTGAPLDCAKPEQVVSILCTPETAYIGISGVRQNRSDWPGGQRRFKKEDEQISRAEFKLLEAIEVFNLQFPNQGRALDIGAAPGGWSRVLAERGLRVDAVDPAELDPRLKPNKSIVHHRVRIQEFDARGPYEIVVNDMKMDARESITIMLEYAPLLKPGGLAVLTLKMPKGGKSTGASRNVLDMLKTDLKRLSTKFEILGARHLYHNRSEVTASLRIKS